ncbi:hypothetical protein VTO42DRAFT_2839 [Malbranchea cinnamomea]
MVCRSALQHLASTAARRTYATAAAELTPRQIELVKATVPALEQHGVAITTCFYKRLFDEHPELKNVFNLAHQATGTQPAALAHSVWAYASNIDRPENLQALISRIGHKHASLNITADQYPIVGQGLLRAIKEVLGDAATPEILDAWTAAYQKLAQYFIDFEGNLYRQNAATPGGWTGWRKFVVKRRIVESDEIVTFHLAPVDHGAIPAYKPGQYIAVRCFVPELNMYQPRQYSLSKAPGRTDEDGGNYFQISVKREDTRDGRPAGKVSNVLHASTPEGAEIELSMPFGDFVLDLHATNPVVLISGGVGLTPMMSMLQTVVEHQQQQQQQQGESRRVVFVHAVRNGRVHAMKEQLARIVRENPNVSRSVWYEDVQPDRDQLGRDYDHQGRIDLARIKDQVLLPDADYFICGPLPFMKLQRDSLQKLGVRPERIHMEVFGSSTE